GDPDETSPSSNGYCRGFSGVRRRDGRALRLRRHACFPSHRGRALGGWYPSRKSGCRCVATGMGHIRDGVRGVPPALFTGRIFPGAMARDRRAHGPQGIPVRRPGCGSKPIFVRCKQDKEINEAQKGSLFSYLTWGLITVSKTDWMQLNQCRGGK
ncbi:MAG: hypothetical protein HW377_1899, partial [Actinobacteria bacterium]|nr:hypothetical protein [Actinomycetota bacterium]